MSKGTLLLHSISGMYGSPGIVMDEKKAKESPCECTGPICFSEGIVGAMDDEQKTWACSPKVEVENPALRKRLENFRDAVETCKAQLPKSDGRKRLESWLNCMGREAEKRGIEL